MNNEGEKICAGASIGIAFYPDHGTDINELISHADTAMYSAKRDGNSICMYRENADEAATG